MEDDFIQSIVFQRIITAKVFTAEDIHDFFKQNNLFPDGGLNYDRFKRIFFPKLFLINESEESEDERQHKINKQNLRLGGTS